MMKEFDRFPIDSDTHVEERKGENGDEENAQAFGCKRRSFSDGFVCILFDRDRSDWSSLDR